MPTAATKTNKWEETPRCGADPPVTPSTTGHLSSFLAAPRCAAGREETQLISARSENFSGFCFPSPP